MTQTDVSTRADVASSSQIDPARESIKDSEGAQAFLKSVERAAEKRAAAERSALLAASNRGSASNQPDVKAKPPEHSVTEGENNIGLPSGSGLDPASSAQRFMTGQFDNADRTAFQSHSMNGDWQQSVVPTLTAQGWHQRASDDMLSEDVVSTAQPSLDRVGSLDGVEIEKLVQAAAPISETPPPEQGFDAETVAVVGAGGAGMDNASSMTAAATIASPATAESMHETIELMTRLMSNWAAMEKSERQKHALKVVSGMPGVDALTMQRGASGQWSLTLHCEVSRHTFSERERLALIGELSRHGHDIESIDIEHHEHHGGDSQGAVPLVDSNQR